MKASVVLHILWFDLSIHFLLFTWDRVAKTEFCVEIISPLSHLLLPPAHQVYIAEFSSQLQDQSCKIRFLYNQLQQLYALYKQTLKSLELFYSIYIILSKRSKLKRFIDSTCMLPNIFCFSAHNCYVVHPIFIIIIIISVCQYLTIILLLCYPSACPPACVPVHSVCIIVRMLFMIWQWVMSNIWTNIQGESVFCYN